MKSNSAMSPQKRERYAQWLRNRGVEHPSDELIDKTRERALCDGSGQSILDYFGACPMVRLALTVTACNPSLAPASQTPTTQFVPFS
jgi:hypothetical protein